MKRLSFIVLAILLCASVSFAGDCKDFCRAPTKLAMMTPMLGAGVSAAAPSYDACPDATHASLLCEDFEKTGGDCGNDAANDTNCEVVWTVGLETGGNVVDFTSAHGGTLTSNYKGSNCVTTTDGSADDEGPRSYYRVGTNLAEEYVQFYFNISTIVGSSSQSQYIASSNPTTTLHDNVAWQLYAYRTSATACGGSAPGYTLNLLHNDGTVRIDAGSVAGICANVWIGVRIYYKYNVTAPTVGISWAVDYDLDGTFTDQTIANPGTTTRYADYLWLTAYNGTTSNTGAVQVDMIKIDATDFPPATVP